MIEQSKHRMSFLLIAVAACSALVGTAAAQAQTPYPILWNKLGSATEVTNSEVGPDGVIVGDASHLPGQFGDGFKDVPRTGDHNIPDNYIRFDDLNLGSQGTIEFWFQPDWVSGGHIRWLFWYGRTDQHYLISIHYNDWQNRLNCGALDADTVTIEAIHKGLVPSATPEWSTTEPVHIAITWDGSAPNPADRLKLYLNGTELGLLIGVGDPAFSDWGDPENALYLSTKATPGDWNRHNWEGAEGVIDNVIIWDYPKSDFSDRFEESPLGIDTDGDGVLDDVDNCPNVHNSEQQDVDADGLGDACDACPNDPDNDIDADAVCGDVDNCIFVANPGQSDVDADAAGDLCDVCPADAADECDTDGSTAEEVPADQGGTVETPDGTLTMDVDPGDLGEDATISVTETIPADPAVDVTVGPNPGLGQAIAVYDLQPDGLVFDNPVTITIVVDVSGLNANQRSRLTLYRYADTDGDGVEDAFVEIPGTICTIIEDPPGTFTATLTAEVDHFSVLGVVAPLDTDNDGIFDLFEDIEDICPNDPNVIEGFLPPMTDLVPEGEAVFLPDKAFKSNRTLPMKFDYSCGAIPVTDQDAATPPELLGVWRVGDAELLPTIELDSGESNDSGSWFRYSDDHWIYNLSTKDLAGGTYEVHVRMPDGRGFKGGFVLR